MKPRLVSHETRCNAYNENRSKCRKLGRKTIRMWGVTYGPYCDDHAESIAASMAEFDQRLDQYKRTGVFPSVHDSAVDR